MFRPSGVSWMTTTSAPARRNTSGAMLIRRAVSSVEHDLASRQRHGRHAGDEEALVRLDELHVLVSGSSGIVTSSRRSARSSSSICSSIASGTFMPSWPKIFTPLSSNGLCEAEIEIAAAASVVRQR